MRSWGSPWGSGHGTSFGGGGSSLLDNYWSERWRLRREMVEREPVTELGAFSSDGAVATEWAKALVDLQDAEVYWLSTVRPDGRPHVTPLLGVWLDGGLYFCTGPAERKAELVI